ncbi:MAG TPA: hypothetical protein VEA58_08700 [Anaerovoracaceae bacterium]|nr:hypothetical protein [Anaerovoracaceae bacterium]
MFTPSLDMQPPFPKSRAGWLAVFIITTIFATVFFAFRERLLILYDRTAFNTVIGYTEGVEIAVKFPRYISTIDNIPIYGTAHNENYAEDKIMRLIVEINTFPGLYRRETLINLNNSSEIIDWSLSNETPFMREAEMYDNNLQREVELNFYVVDGTTNFVLNSPKGEQLYFGSHKNRLLIYQNSVASILLQGAKFIFSDQFYLFVFALVTIACGFIEKDSKDIYIPHSAPKNSGNREYRVS